MSSKLFKSVFSLYNFLGTLGLTFRMRSYKVSNVKVFLSFCVILICMIFADVFSLYFQKNNSPIFRYRNSLMDKLSTLTRITIIFSGSSSRIVVILFSVLQILQRHKISLFINHVSNMSLDEKHWKIFRNSSIKSATFLVLLFSFSIIIYYFGVLQPSLSSALYYIMSVHQQVVIIGFVSFVKVFEIFIVVQMKQLCQELEELSNASKTRYKNLVTLMRRHQNIYTATKMFKHAFEPQTSLVTCSFIQFIVLQVNSSLIGLQLCKI